MDTFTRLAFYLCISLTTVTAYPYSRQANTASNPNLKDFCSVEAVNKLLSSFQLPGIGQEVIDHASYRVKRDNSENTDTLYLRNIMADALTQLPGTENTLDNLRLRLGFANDGDKQEQLKIEIRNMINELTSLREICLQSIENDEFNIAEQEVGGANAYISREAAPQSGDIDMDESSISEDEFGNSYVKRNKLAFNPSGWRKRRSNRETERERMAHFLSNMRQLLDKRQQRLNFNPTGW